jgi:hypothetical protein
MGLLDKLFDFMKTTEIGGTPLQAPRPQSQQQQQPNWLGAPQMAAPSRPQSTPANTTTQTANQGAGTSTTTAAPSGGGVTPVNPTANKTNDPNEQRLLTNEEILGNTTAGNPSTSSNPATDSFLNNIARLQGGQPSAEGTAAPNVENTANITGATASNTPLVNPVSPSSVNDPTATSYVPNGAMELDFEGQKYRAQLGPDNRTVRFYDPTGAEIVDPAMRSKLATTRNNALFQRESVSTLAQGPNGRPLTVSRPGVGANGQQIQETWEMRMQDGILQTRKSGEPDEAWGTPADRNIDISPFDLIEPDFKNARTVSNVFKQGDEFYVGDYNGTRLIFDQNGNQVDPASLPGGREGRAARELLQPAATLQNVFKGVQGANLQSVTLNPAELGIAFDKNGNPVSLPTIVRENNGQFDLISLTYKDDNGNTRLMTEDEALRAFERGGALSLGRYATREQAEAASTKLRSDFENGVNSVTQQLNWETANRLNTQAVQPGERVYEFGKQKVVFRNGVFRDANRPTETIAEAANDPELVKRVRNDIRLASAVSPLARATVQAQIAREEYMEKIAFTPPKEKRSFWQTLKGMGWGALQGFLTNGIGGALGGAVAGGVLGTINPNFDDKARNQMFGIPKAKARLDAAESVLTATQAGITKDFDLQKDAAALLKTQAETLNIEVGLLEKLRQGSTVWSAIMKQGYANQSDIDRFEAEMTTMLRSRNLLGPNQTFQSFLTPFTSGKWEFAMYSDDGVPMFRNEYNNQLVPGTLLGDRAPFKVTRQSEREATVELGNSSFVLYGTPKQISDQMVELAKFYTGAEINRDEALARLKVTVASQNANALNQRGTAIANLQVEVAKQVGIQQGAGQVASQITERISNAQKDVDTQAKRLTGNARVTTEEITAYNAAQKRLFDLQQEYVKHLRDNLSAFTTKDKIEELITALPDVTLVDMPTVKALPALRLGSPRAVSPLTTSPGAGYRPPTQNDNEVDNVINSRMINPVQPRGRSNKNTQVSA